MPKKVKPEVKITLDKERTLRFDLNAMASFEEATGKSIFNKKVRDEMSAGMSAKMLRALLWSMLVGDDETLTLKQVGIWITPGKMAEIAEEVIKAFENAMPEPEEKTEGKEADPLAASPPPG